MNKFRENIDEIKAHLIKFGGIFVTNRQCGKTQALLELLHEDDYSYLVTFNLNQRNHLANRYCTQYDDGGEDRIIINPTRYQVANGYIDEYFFHRDWYKDFKGAVSTMPFPIVIKKLYSNTNENDMEQVLDEISFAKEISLNFTTKEKYKMNRQDVYKLIDGERAYQDSLIEKAVYENQIHSVAAEILIINEYANRAQKAWTENFGDEAGLDVVRKIAALCVRCMEHHDTKSR
jgi:hypothetical protein